MKVDMIVLVALVCSNVLTLISVLALAHVACRGRSGALMSTSPIVPPAPRPDEAVERRQGEFEPMPAPTMLDAASKAYYDQLLAMKMEAEMGDDEPRREKPEMTRYVDG